MNEEIESDVRKLKKAVFGDMDNPKQTPGIIAEMTQMNSTMLEMRDIMRKIAGILLTSFITALCVLVFKSV